MWDTCREFAVEMWAEGPFMWARGPIGDSDGRQRGEPQSDFTLCRLHGVAAVNEVLLRFESEVAADRTRKSLVDRVGSAGQLTESSDGSGAFEHCGHQRTGGDELQQARVERTLGVIYLIGTPAQPRRIGRGLALIVAPILIHGVWDSMLAIAGGSSSLVFVIMIGDIVFAFTALWIAFVWAHPRESHFVRDILAPEIESGVLTDAEVTAAGGWRQQRTYAKAAPTRTERRQRRHIVRAALDLCSDLAVSKGDDSPQVVESRNEITRLRQGTAAQSITR